MYTAREESEWRKMDASRPEHVLINQVCTGSCHRAMSTKLGRPNPATRRLSYKEGRARVVTHLYRALRATLAIGYKKLSP